MIDSSPRRLPQLPQADTSQGARVMDRLEAALDGLRYGEVTVIVQDGIVVQLERTDRLRLTQRGRHE